MENKKVCSMNEIKPIRKHEIYDHNFVCECSLCNNRITATADFDKKGNLTKVYYHINFCPNCGAEIEKFVQYGDEK